jgi:hypothetical protein
LATFFLYTFLVGAGLTVVSFLLGMVDISGLGHVGHGHIDVGAHGHGGDFGHGGHAGHAGHAGDVSGAHGDTAPHAHAATVSPVNFQTLVAFMVGFGGVGYQTVQSGWPFWLAVIPVAVAGGVATGWVVFRFMRFLARGERPLAPTSYVGLVGRLTVGIRAGGTGELVYSQNGTRMVASARSLDGTPIPKGVDVVVLRYEKGIAYVEPLRGETFDS